MSAVTVVLGDGDDHLAGHLLMGGHVLVLAADGVGPLKGAVALLVVVLWADWHEREEVSLPSLTRRVRATGGLTGMGGMGAGAGATGMMGAGA